MEQHSGLKVAVGIIVVVLLVAAGFALIGLNLFQDEINSEFSEIVDVFGPDGTSADGLPSLSPRDGLEVAQADLPLLLPTLVPYPTVEPTTELEMDQQADPVQQESNPFQLQTPQTTESDGEASQQPVLPFGDLPADFQPGDPNSSTTESQPFLPPGVTQEDIESGNGGFQSNLSSPFGDVDEDQFDFSGSDSDTSGGSPFGDLPFDPNAGPTGGSDTPFGSSGFGDTPFGAAMSRYYIAAEQPVSLFECAEATCDVVGSLESNDPIEIVDQVGEWVEIEYRSGTAFVYSGFVGEREPMDDTPFGAGGSPFDGGDFPFDNNNSGDFPFGSNGPTTSSQGSVQTGQYNQGSGFSIGRGFSLGGNALYDEPTNNNNNSGFPWDDFNNGDSGLGTDCPPFLPNC